MTFFYDFNEFFIQVDLSMYDNKFLIQPKNWKFCQ